MKSFCFSPSMYILLLFTDAYFSFPCSLLLCICFRNTSASFHNHHVYIRPSLPLFSSSTKFPDSSHLCSSCFLFFTRTHIYFGSYAFKLFYPRSLYSFMQVLKAPPDSAVNQLQLVPFMSVEAHYEHCQ